MVFILIIIEFVMAKFDTIAKAGWIVFIGVLFSKIFGYLFRIVVARTDLELYGTYNLAFSIIGFLIPFVMLGLDGGLIKYGSYYKGKNARKKLDIAISTALKTIILTSAVFAFPLFFFSNKIADFFDTPMLGIFLRFFSLIIPLMALFNISSSVLTVNKKVGAVVFADSVFNNFLRLVILAGLFYIGAREFGVILAFLVSYFISMIFVFYSAKKYFTFRIKGFDFKLLKLSLYLLLVFVIGSLLVRTDTIMLGILANVSEVGLYNSALPTAQLLLIFSLSFLAIFLPVITIKYSRGQNIREDFQSVTKWIFLSTFPFALLMIFFSKEILLILFGEEYISASATLSILSFSYIFYILGHTSEKVLIMFEKIKVMLLLVLGVFILNILLNLILIPYFHISYGHGMYGAAISTGISLFIISFFHIVYAARYSEVKIFNKEYLGILSSGIISIFIVYLIKKLLVVEGIFSFTILSLSFLVLYVFLILFFELLFFKEGEFSKLLGK